MEPVMLVGIDITRHDDVVCVTFKHLCVDEMTADQFERLCIVSAKETMRLTGADYSWEVVVGGEVIEHGNS